MRTAHDGVSAAYFTWLCAFVTEKRRKNYEKLFIHLHKRAFEWVNKRDENRAADGIALRERFERGFSGQIPDEFYAGPCSILEMMVALALRIETEIMYDPEISGDKTGRWFWLMCDNLGLSEFQNMAYDGQKIDEILDIWMHLKYAINGIGSPFPRAEGAGIDQRNVEIWYQMSAYLQRKFPI